MMKRKVIASAVIISIVSISVIAVVLLQYNANSMDSRIQSLMHEGDIPSLSAAIIINDSIVWSRGYGDQPDGIDTVYMIGSVTKMFAATAIMQLYDSDTLELDADVNNYIPFSVRNPNHPSTEITIRHLLSHSSGISKVDIPLWDFNDDFLLWSNDNLGTNYTPMATRPTMGEFLNGTLNPAGLYYDPANWKTFAPGSQWQYSNLAYLLLAYIVQQLANQTYEEYLQDYVFDPLDMESTGFHHADFVGRNAIPYEWSEGENFAGPLYDLNNVGGGGLRSTIPDLAKFLIAHMNQGSYGTSQILQPQTVAMMQTSEYSMSGSELGGYSYAGQGLGWGLYQGDIVGHGGACPGYLANIAFKTVNNGKYGIVINVNRGASIAEDNYLVYTFFPSMIDLLFEEAARLFSE